jgi:hypothetical protein
MDSLPQHREFSDPKKTDPKEEARDRAHQQLQGVLKELKEVRKCLRRDWEHLAPRERSAQSRVVKELEQQKQLLEDEIEMNSGS